MINQESEQREEAPGTVNQATENSWLNHEIFMNKFISWYNVMWAMDHGMEVRKNTQQVRS